MRFLSALSQRIIQVCYACILIFPVHSLSIAYLQSSLFIVKHTKEIHDGASGGTKENPKQGKNT